MNSTNQVTPYGTLTYTQTGSTTYRDPYTGESYSIPTYTATTQLSPEQQRLYEQQTGIQSGLNTTAQGLLDNVGGKLTQPVDLSRAALDPYIRDNFADDFNKQWDTNYSNLETRLANQGIKAGSAAYTKALDDFNTSRGNAYDNFLGSMYSTAQNALLTERNQPLDELSMLLGQGRPTNPQFQSTPGGSIGPTNTAGIINQDYQNQMENYNAQVAQNNAFMNGVTDIAGAALSGWKLSDERLKKDLHKVGEVEVYPDQAGGEDIPVYAYELKGDAARKALGGPLQAMGRAIGGNGAMGGGLSQLGMLAQDVEKVLPQAVAKLPSGYRVVNYEEVARKAR